MIRVSLRFFASHVLRTRRMDQSDRKTLQHVIFSDGVRSRVEAEVLLQLARLYAARARSSWVERCVALAADGQGRFRLWHIERIERSPGN